MIKRRNGSEISPCILGKVKHALGLSAIEPQNIKTCSKLYWNEIVEIISLHEGIENINEILAAKQKYDRYANRKTIKR